MNINSIGSDTPVKNTANPADKNIDLYLFFLSASTFLYIAKAIPINDTVEANTCPTLKRAGITVANNSLYAAVSPAAFKFTRSVIHANQSGSCPATT